MMMGVCLSDGSAPGAKPFLLATKHSGNTRQSRLQVDQSTEYNDVNRAPQRHLL